ncbi:Ig-like domain repeat protein [Streptomyces lydicus]|uniref:Ig-like domain repeat protein n=1 Tax=Streptomyces lydicus TaxID=47763 RepID=UPI0037B9EBA3
MAINLTLSPSSLAAGGTFTVTATGAAPGEALTFTYDAATPQTVVADGTGSATVSFTATTTGAVVVAGPTSGAASATLTVTAATNCVVTVTSSPATPTAGQPVTVTATVTCNGVPVPGATVVFTAAGGSLALGVGTTNASGQASVTTSALPAGNNVVVALVVSASTTCTCVGVSGTATVNVGAATNCVVTVTSSPANPTAGQPVTVTATVTCNGVPVPGAVVVFASSGGALQLGFGTTNASGQATVTSSLLPAGSNVVTATVVSASTTCTCVGVSGTATVNVGAATNCVVTVTSSPANPTAGQPVTVTATVTCNGVPVPGAVVLFTTTSGALGLGITGATGQASVTTTALPAGSNVVTATVLSAGTTCNCTGASGTATVTVGVGNGTLTAKPACYALNFPPVPWAFAHATFSASGATPGSTVTFSVLGGTVCTAVADASGNASCTANLSITQALAATYTASSGGVTVTGTLGPCLN